MLREFCGIRNPADAHKLDFECWGCPACVLGLLYWSESCHFADLHRPSALLAHAGKTLKISACDFALFYVPQCSCASLTHPQRSLSAMLLLVAECPVIWPNLMSLSGVPSEEAVCLGSLQHFPHSYCLIQDIASYERWVNHSLPVSFQFIFFLQMIIECLIYIKDFSTTRKYTIAFETPNCILKEQKISYDR